MPRPPLFCCSVRKYSLQQNSSPTALHLFVCALRCRVLIGVCRIVFQRNAIGEGGASAFAEALEKNHTLTTLDISVCTQLAVVVGRLAGH